MNMLAAHTDSALRHLADAGDKDAQREMARRGLAADPTMENERRRAKREFRVHTDWAWR